MILADSKVQESQTQVIESQDSITPTERMEIVQSQAIGGEEISQTPQAIPQPELVSSDIPSTNVQATSAQSHHTDQSEYAQVQETVLDQQSAMKLDESKVQEIEETRQVQDQEKQLPKDQSEPNIDAKEVSDGAAQQPEAIHQADVVSQLPEEFTRTLREKEAEIVKLKLELERIKREKEVAGTLRRKELLDMEQKVGESLKGEQTMEDTRHNEVLPPQLPASTPR